MEKLKKKKNCVLKHDESFLIKIVNIQGYLHVQNKIYDWAGLTSSYSLQDWAGPCVFFSPV